MISEKILMPLTKVNHIKCPQCKSEEVKYNFGANNYNCLECKMLFKVYY